MLLGKESISSWREAAGGVPDSLEPTAFQFQDAPTPQSSAELKSLADAIVLLMEARRYTEALEQIERLLQQAQAKNDPVGRLYAFSLKGFVMLQTDQPAESATCFQQVEQISRELGDTAYEVEARLYRSLALWRVDRPAAELALDDAVRQARQEQRRPVAVANACNRASVEWYLLGEIAKAQRCCEQARTLYARYVPNSLELAHSLNNLGALAQIQGALADAQRYLEEALTLYEQLVPNTPTLAVALGNLGMLARERGDFNGAMRYYERALKIFEQQEPISLNLATTLNNIGSVALVLGDSSLAQQYFEQALSIEERLAPDTVRVADTLNNLGRALQERGKYEDARRRYDAAVNIYRKRAPDSPNFASVLVNLG
ncbi:MAG: tetratricopeptide repeat protein, partial [Fimbriimonadales bacterium]|nr:tetratricopeptide repeat protein [Fimbriimonadales bacterium]